MKALSVRPPYAGFIASGQKTLELRTKRTHYRGELLICQSRGGGAVAIVEVLDCREATPADAERACVDVVVPGYFAWEIRLVRRVTSPPIKGKLSFYDVPEACLEAFV